MKITNDAVASNGDFRFYDAIFHHTLLTNGYTITNSKILTHRYKVLH